MKNRFPTRFLAAIGAVLLLGTSGAHSEPDTPSAPDARSEPDSSPEFDTPDASSEAEFDTPPRPTDPSSAFEPPTKERESVIEVSPRENAPTVRAITPLDESRAFFLNRRGRIGIAEFSPGLELEGWQFYSRVRLNPLDALAAGASDSILVASASELTQCFDTDRDGRLDFYQALLRQWPGREAGVTITAGPVTDSHGRLIFALSPHAPEADSSARAAIVAWHPLNDAPVTVTRSRLRVEALALDDGLLAARLRLPEYRDGYYLSLTKLPPFDPADPDAAPDPLPSTRPSLVIPAELTRSKPPGQLCFFRENGTRKLLVTCPESRQLIEVVPEQTQRGWQGAILLRAGTETAVEALAELGPGALIGGGGDGFTALGPATDAFRISRVALAQDGIVLDFTAPVDRSAAVRPESYTLRSVALQGGTVDSHVVEPVVESDAGTVILRNDRIATGTVLRIVCRGVMSETGEELLGDAAFYTVHER